MSGMNRINQLAQMEDDPLPTLTSAERDRITASLSELATLASLGTAFNNVLPEQPPTHSAVR